MSTANQENASSKSNTNDNPDFQTIATSKLKRSAFAQQRISAWQPVLAPKWMTYALALFGLAFVALGIVLIYASHSVIECIAHYEDPSHICVETGECQLNIDILASDCEGGSFRTYENGIPHISPPIYLYYSLTNFYQNHRRYMLSRSSAQLQGEVIIDGSRLSACKPALWSDEGYRILTPCGLAARSVFNDTFRIKSSAASNIYVDLNDRVEDIVWPSSMRTYYKNPSDGDAASLNKLDQWLSEEIFPGKMENAHFMVWMRNAALPNFRKLYARIDDDLSLPVTVEIMNRYPVSTFGGKKYVVLSTTSWLGGKNPFLGIMYVSLGALFFAVGLLMAIKNRRDPRILGDVRYLKWTNGKQN